MDKQIKKEAKNNGMVVIDKSRFWTSVVLLAIAVILSQFIIATTWKATFGEKVTNHIDDTELHQTYKSKIDMFVTRKEFNAYKERWDNIADKIDILYLRMIEK